MGNETPWSICPYGGASDGSSVQVNSGPGWFMEFSMGYPLSEFPDPGDALATFEEDCANIITAVNNHDELVKVAKQFVASFPEHVPSERRDQTRALLSRINGDER